MENYDKNRAELINEMMDKYGYLFCQKCGKNKCGMKLGTHHIIFRSEVPDHPMLHHKRNLLICGSDCHQDAPDSFHKDKAQRNKFVVERELEWLFNRPLIIEK